MGVYLQSDDYQATIIFPAQTALPHGAAFGWTGDKSVFAGDVQDAADAIKIDVTTSGLHNSWCDDVTPAFIEVKFGPTPTATTAVVTYTEAGGETGSVGAVAPAILVSKRTALGGRKNRGRMYIPGQSESAMEPGGFVQAATLADVQSRVDSLLGKLTADDLPMVIGHSDPGDTFAPIVTALVVSPILATQRRRQRR